MPLQRTLVSLVSALALLLSSGTPTPASPAPTAPAAAPPKAGRIVLQVLSNRADLVSGGDVLLKVRLPRQVRRRHLVITVGGRVVTKHFRHTAPQTYVGLVRRLKNGRNLVVASAKGARTTKAVVTNHDQGGPVLTGPVHVAYDCQDTARDARCNEPPRYSWLYQPSGGPAGLKPYSRKNSPTDVATTTTDRGVRVPFIVRREDGYADRDRYSILTLFRPGKRWHAWRPQDQWNHKLLVTHGGGCGASYHPEDPNLQDSAGTLRVAGAKDTYVEALSRGFAVMATSLSNTGHNCNVAYNAESLMMAKERVVERYGTLRYTIGTGCSGGSVAQHTIANAYPGIYQGLVVTCSYPDVMSPGAQFADYHLMRLYFEHPSRWGAGVLWSPTQMADVEGHLTHANAVTADELLFKKAFDPELPCGGVPHPVPGDRTTRYDSETNPGGVRCSVLDLMVNQLGRRPQSVWSAQEKAAGHGFAGFPVGNAGIQYGLNALLGGRITPAQFVDLNAKLGGLDVNNELTAGRLLGDPASVARAYRTGLLNEFTHTDEVAMINHGGPDPGVAHDYSHAVWSHLRLQRDQGHTDNRVEWFGPTPLVGDLAWPVEAFDRMDEWLAAVEKDRRPVPLAQKIVEDRPATLTDRCHADGVPGVLCENDLARTHLSTPRQEAGGPATNDVLACRLVPLDRAAYTYVGGHPIPFTDAEWATLQATFPGGVCDWLQPGLGQGVAETWLTYSDASGKVAYGGRALPRVPRRSMTGWQGKAFREIVRQ
ncbi:hypothetical protein DDE18_00805 [Nocardioides gansuensis]|uniref:DUF6351 domain-containing protein n=1 Tax=Nocardioides gansuensis TaxID=2138300 RepID=A0A2T8FET4_9ACTN|nr:DUF6351 family protein [Nocardioides gansuensis]PVG84215.1 hypothetical protein DDE18_00805 [Nocardioides gansuensis]